MDLKSLTREDIKKMTEEEKREFVHQLIHNEDSSIQAVLFDVSTGEHLSIQEMIERKGEEEVVEMLVQGLTNSDAVTEQVTGEKIREALMRLQKGEATDEDLRLLTMVKEVSRRASPMRDMGTHLTSMLLEFVCYYQERHNIAVSCFDLDTIMSILQTVNAIHNPALETYKFHGCMPHEILDVTDAIADDILSTWEASLTTEYSTEMKYLAAVSLVRKLSEKLNTPLLKAEQLADILDFDLSDIKEIIEEERKEEAEHNHKCDCDGTCGNTCQPAVHDATNGSNDSSDENEDMKNLMKGN